MVVTEYFSCYLYYFHYLHEYNDMNIVIKFQKLKDSVRSLSLSSPFSYPLPHFSEKKKSCPPSTPTSVIFIAIVSGGA